MAQLMKWSIFAWCLLIGAAAPGQEFRAGGAAVDITPPRFPVRVNGMFTERSASRALDPLHARSVALDDGKTKIVLCVVDTCMMPRELIDQAKQGVEKKTGLANDRIMVAATHTHSAPAAMGCLGSRMDPDYAKWLPGKLTECMARALENLQPARIGWASVDDWEHTHNRRWIARLDRTGGDPFGGRTVHANMHPGHLSKNVIGPSGPVDPELSLFAVQTRKGIPLALFANYSQHYYGSGLLSADYFGAFCRHVARRLGQPSSEGPFVAMLSQGTSGDLMWMDYGAARRNQSMDDYADEVADYAMRAYQQIQWNDHVPLAMVESTLALDWRRPDVERLEWAEDRMNQLNGRLPQSQQDIYAMEASILHRKPRAELKLQAIRIGELGIATLPNEVYALTGLKLKAHSPFDIHFNIELANGAEGYIPPVEQHALGGYTTWPARTAGLEVGAEPLIVESLLQGLEKAAGRKRDPAVINSTAYKQSGVLAHWPLDDLGGNTAAPNHGLTHAPMRIVGKVARYLPGVGSGSGCGEEEALTASPLSGKGDINRSMHMVDGYFETGMKLPADFTVAVWYWLGERSGAGEREGSLVRLPMGQTLAVRQDANHQSRLSIGTIKGTSRQQADEWNLAVVVTQQDRIRVYVNGGAQPDLEVKTTGSKPMPVRFGEGLEGKLDEIALWGRSLDASEQQSFWLQSGIAEKRARKAEARRHAEREAAKRANPPGWPANHATVIKAMSPVRHDRLDRKPEGMAAEQSVRFSSVARAAFDTGRIRGTAKSLGAAYAASFWFRNDLPNRERAVTAYLFSRGPDGNSQAPGDHLGIGGNYRDSYPGKLLLFNGNEANQVLTGKTVMPPGTWNHAVLVRDGERARVWLNGRLEIDGTIRPTTGDSKEIYLGARSDFFAPLQGYLAEFALFDRALTGREARDLYVAAKLIDLSDRASIEKRRPILIAHRGGVVRDDSPECSLEAIRLAAEAGYAMVELDVQRSSDGVPMVFHDRTLKEACGVDGRVGDYTAADLVEIPYTDSTQKIVSLDSALSLCRELHLGLMLDLKEGRDDESFLKTIDQMIVNHKLARAAVSISGSSTARKALRHVMFTPSKDQMTQFRETGKADLRGTFWFGLPGQLPSADVVRLQENGALVFPAINTFRYPGDRHLELAREDMARLVSARVDGFQIDSVYADLLKRN